METPKLLIAWHSRTGASEALAAAVAQGAGEVAVLKRADSVEPVDFTSSDGFVFVCPENLAAISGQMKEMFDRCYYPVLGKIEGRLYATVIAAGSDGKNAERQIDRIATGWRLKRVAEPIIVNCDAQTPEEILASKKVQTGSIKVCEELGAAIKTGLELGIY